MAGEPAPAVARNCIRSAVPTQIGMVKTRLLARCASAELRSGPSSGSTPSVSQAVQPFRPRNRASSVTRSSTASFAFAVGSVRSDNATRLPRIGSVRTPRWTKTPVFLEAAIFKPRASAKVLSSVSGKRGEAWTGTSTPSRATPAMSRTAMTRERFKDSPTEGNSSQNYSAKRGKLMSIASPSVPVRVDASGFRPEVFPAISGSGSRRSRSSCPWRGRSSSRRP